MSQTIEWKYKALFPDKTEKYIAEEDSISCPRGTIFTRVRIISGIVETPVERTKNYRRTRKKDKIF